MPCEKARLAVSYQAITPQLLPLQKENVAQAAAVWKEKQGGLREWGKFLIGRLGRSNRPANAMWRFRSLPVGTVVAKNWVKGMA